MRQIKLAIVAAALLASPASAQECVLETPAEGEAFTLSRPIAGSVVREFGLQYDEATKKKAQHTGVDFEAREGEPVYASQRGKVIAVEEAGELGKVIRIDHGSGLATLYGHLSAAVVGAGACVKSGEEIGKAGATGKAPGPQLHFEVVRDGTPVNPLELLP